jgi:diguanylate cyclase (GGDEF)-like protein/PAS domain S-box-containing protein
MDPGEKSELVGYVNRVPSRLLRVLLPTGPLLLNILAVGALWVIVDARHQARDRAALEAANLTTLVEREMARSIASFDLSVQTAIASFGLPGIESVDPVIRQAALFDGASRAPYLGALIITDAAGDRVHESVATVAREGNVSGRDYFLVHRDQPDIGLYISRPFRRMHGGDWAIAISRRLPSADGRLTGIVAGTMKLAGFAELVRDLRLGKRGAVTVLRTDGTIIARFPSDGSLTGTRLSNSRTLARFSSAPSGEFEDVSVIDRIPLLYAYRQIGDYPLLVVTTIPLDVVYAAWFNKALQIAAVVIALGGSAMLLVMLLRREVAQRDAAERTARASGEQYRALAEHSSDVILRIGMDLICRYVSPAALSISGYQPDEVVGQPCLALLHPDDHSVVQQMFDRLRRQSAGSQAASIYRVVHRNGSIIWIETHSTLIRNPETGESEEIVTIARDITTRKHAEDARAAATNELARQATMDALTGLANRRQFDVRLDQEWSRAVRSVQSLSLLMLDVDCFKLYNDRYGHQKGDEVLRAIGKAIGSTVRRPGDVAARYGGEEFAVILPDTSAEGAVQVADAILDAVAGCRIPHDRSSTGTVTISVGVASVVPTKDIAATALISRADHALYAAKAEGRNRIMCFEPADRWERAVGGNAS